MARKFRYTNAQERIPFCFPHLEVIHKESGKSLDGVIEANADEGWLIRHAVDSSGKTLFENGEYVRERIEADIEIVLRKDHPYREPDVNVYSDIEAGCIYEEDLTDADRAWIMNGCPRCSVCWHTPVAQQNLTCEGCVRREQRRNIPIRH